MVALRRLALLALLAGCGGRAGLPPPSLPLAATPADAIPDPPPAPADAPVRIEARSERLPNGMRVVVAPRPAEGLSTVVFLDESAAGRDARATRTTTEAMAFAMQDATETPRGVVPSYARREGFDLRLGVRARALVAAATFDAGQLGRFLGVLDAVLRRPAFRDERMADLVARRIETVEGELVTAEGILDDRLPGLLYAETDPRHAPLRRARAELVSLGPRMLRARHAQVLDPASCTLIVVGEVDPDAALAAARATFEGWSRPPSPAQIVPVSHANGAVRGVGVIRPLLRPWIGVLERAPALDHPDHAAFLLLSQILGAMFSSRLNLLVRESQTASYGLGAAYDADPDAGELRLVTAVEPERVGAFVLTLLQELGRVRGQGEGIEERELAIARVRARQTYRDRLDTTAGLAMVIAEHVLADLPVTHAEEVLEQLDSLSADELEAAARRWIRPERAPIGIVAAAEVFSDQLARLPLGRFEVITPPPRVRR